MISKLTSIVFISVFGVVAGCRGPAVSPSNNAAPLSSPVSSPAPSTSSTAPASSSLQAVASSEPPPKDAPETSEVKCPAAEPTVSAEFVPVKLDMEPSKDEGMVGTAEVRGKLPAISKDGRTVAILNNRITWDGKFLFLVLQDVRTGNRTPFMLWTDDKAGKVRLEEAQTALDKTTWQALVPGKIGEDPCASDPTKVDPKALRFKTTEFQFGGDGFKVELMQRTGSTEKKFDLKVRNLPGIMGEGALPNLESGGGCGAWAFLQDGWVSQDNKIYLFELGAFLGGRCGPPITPLEHFVWVAK